MKNANERYLKNFGIDLRGAPIGGGEILPDATIWYSILNGEGSGAPLSATPE